ncbi:class I SAM-dependent methyltransferase [Mycobacterium celatum]|uniref:Methyltransferase n=1 Tax=Mycobacterium celatum TaxID=28045 RepID=A0A1X1RX68_MYCCE|nr:class I SAM-dependent methyltransferase [Mycobacterium celatum]ORV19693.1 methyltransferase [Mycobacterium celatum]PIB74992.1 class I SAM-dependent methyltransferase [Mycobacterium celatum]
MTDKVDFSGVRWGSVEWTNLCTLYLRAYESRLAQPILGDRAAADAVDRIDYDFARVHRRVQPSVYQFLVALRAKQLDDWAADFLDHNPDAVVLHLGCGLDTRYLRLQPTQQWFDVDVPQVISLRRQLYDDTDGYRMIGSSVTDPQWVDQIPAGRPGLIVAEGLLMYLSEAEIRALLQRLLDRFDHGELLADLEAPWAPRLSKIFTKGIVKSGTRDGRESSEWNPRLKLVEITPIVDPAQIPLRPQRAFYRLVGAIPVVRNFDRLFRFRF